MKDRLFFVLLAASILSGCGATGRLYPVRGPLSGSSACAGLGCQNSRRIQFRKHFRCCSPMARYAKALGNCASPSSFHWLGCRHCRACRDMSPEWDTVYGTGFYVSHGPGC